MNAIQKLKPITLLASLALFGCMDDSSSNLDPSGPVDYSLSSSYRLGAVSPTTFERILDYTSCSKDKMVSESDTSSLRYSFAGDTLFIHSYDCKNAYIGGTKNKLSGTWTLKNVLPNEDTDGSEDCVMPKDYTEKLKFTSSSYTRIKEISDFCWGETDGKEYADDLSDDVEFKVIDCGTIQATDGAGNVARRTLSSIDPSTLTAEWKYTYNGKSCTKVDKQVEASEQTCADSYAAYKKDGSEEYFDWYDWTKEETSVSNCIENLQVSEDLKDFF